MAFELIIKPIVFADTEEAVEYYEKKSKGLGNRFLYNLFAALEEIQSHPFSIHTLRIP